VRAKRLLRLLALVLVYLLVAEAGLQIAAWFMQRSVRAGRPAAWLTGNLRVLCVGDSHTYGIWVERSEAYPQQLESLWNQRSESPRLEVINLGVPGTSSSSLLRELPGLLGTFDPDLLIVMVGGNDFWTIPTPLEDGESPPREGFLKRHSLLYRLWFLFQRGRQQAQAPEVILDPNASLEGTGRHRIRIGEREIEMPFTVWRSGERGSLEALSRNLRRIIQLARDGNRSVYLMTYPSKQNPYLTASMVIEQVAQKTGTPLIDLLRVFAKVCPKTDCPDTVFPDGHPKAPGYRIVAEAIADRLASPGEPARSEARN
jgi:lysophospholipase L1-like esterase